MGNAVKSFAKGVAKAAITGAGTAVPVIGGPLASWINSKFAKGSYDIGNPGVEIPDDRKTKAINTPAQLKALVKANPEEAAKSGLTIEKIDQEVKEAKEQAKAVGGMVKLKEHAFLPKVGMSERTALDKPPSKAVGGKVKEKKPRTAAQEAATKRLVEANRKRKEKK